MTSEGKYDDARWQEQLTAAVAYHTKLGRWPSTQLGDWAERICANWIGKQRVAYRAGKLSDQRRQALLDAGIELEPWATTWATQLVELAAFHADKSRWPSSHSKDSTEHRLGIWLNLQRQRAGQLSQQQRQALAEAGVELHPGREMNSDEAYWDARLTELAAFHATQGRWPSVTSENVTERRLAKWLNRERVACRAGRDLLSKRRRAALAKAGIELYPQQLRWAKQLSKLKKFYAKHNHWPARGSSNQAERSLALWLDNQQTAYRAGRLSDEQRQAMPAGALEAKAPEVDSRRQTHWADRLAQLGVFRTENGRWPSTRSEDPEERGLAAWLNTQRMEYRAGRLSIERQQALRSTGVKGFNLAIGNTFDEYWLIRLNQVRDFRASQGRWPSRSSKDPDELQQANWMNNQRADYRGGKLPGWRRQALLDAGVELSPGVSDEERENHWEERLAGLKSFHATQGRWPSQTSQDPAERKLANWLIIQRAAYRAGRMPEHRRQGLHSAGVKRLGR